MAVHGIREDLLLTLLALGKSQHPNEFIAILREEDGIIEAFDLAPGTQVNECSASFFHDMMPLDTHVAGSAHSHPNGVLLPSDADLRFFGSVGRYHIIVGPPYTTDAWRCFFPDGSPAELEVVP